MFMIGWTIQVSLNLLKKRKHAFSSGLALLNEVLLHEDSFKFALFLSNLMLVYRSSSCALRRLTTRVDESVNMMISGFLSGFSMSFFPSTQIALHTFWKTMFTMYFMRFGYTSRSQSVLDNVFLVMNSFMIHCMVMESRFVPRSYLRLIDSFTGSCLTKFNIVTICMLAGRDNTFRYGDQFPQLNADYVSKKYMETIGCWSLERHDA